MNLFQKASDAELHDLINKTDENTPIHNIVIDYDGEVLIDPELTQPEVDLSKFKYRVQLSTYNKAYFKRGSKWLHNLYKQLKVAWNGKGESMLSM
jgi:hypothetical protein